jgi:hypothetical protein
VCVSVCVCACVCERERERELFSDKVWETDMEHEIDRDRVGKTF